MPNYTVGEAAHYLRLPVATVRAWVMGRPYPTQGGPRRASPVLEIPRKKPPLLSFMNLAEAHVLGAMTREHDIPLQRVRRAVRYLQRDFKTSHPLVARRFETDGRDLFIQEAERLINVSQEGQTAIREALELYLTRIEWDDYGLVATLFPFTGRAYAEAPRAVMIDPNVAFGKPVLTGTSIPTLAIAERFKAGETEDELARDFGRERTEIEEAIRCELAVAA
ncbi:MAG: DUF433 domain-containing protein [Planctomycetes bacterium]|nr:DUF433 domain-containing protein [Planctomycetota bacterium]